MLYVFWRVRLLPDWRTLLRASLKTYGAAAPPDATATYVTLAVAGRDEPDGERLQEIDAPPVLQSHGLFVLELLQTRPPIGLPGVPPVPVQPPLLHAVQTPLTYA